MAVTVGHSFDAAGAVAVQVASLVMGSGEQPSESVESSTVSVGDDEDSLSTVRSAHVGRSDREPLRIEPERGNILEHTAEPSLPQHGHVLPDAPLGLELAGEPEALGPEPPRIVDSESMPGNRDRLTGKSAAEDRDLLRAATVHLANVVEKPNAGPVPTQHRPAVWVALSLEGDWPKPGALQAKLEAADA
jgi:hypothetical protein